MRLRLYAPDGRLLADSFPSPRPPSALADPRSQPWYQKAARTLDRGMDAIAAGPARAAL
jgi:two-component system sensor histidine kinase ChvG